MEREIIMLYFIFKLCFICYVVARNEISNYYSNIPYVAEMPVKEDNELELSFD